MLFRFFSDLNEWAPDGDSCCGLMATAASLAIHSYPPRRIATSGVLLPHPLLAAWTSMYDLPFVGAPVLPVPRCRAPHVNTKSCVTRTIELQAAEMGPVLVVRLTHVHTEPVGPAQYASNSWVILRNRLAVGRHRDGGGGLPARYTTTPISLFNRSGRTLGTY